MSKKKKPEKSIEELLQNLEQYILEYKSNKTLECYKNIRRTCRTISALTVNPTTPPPTTTAAP